MKEQIDYEKYKWFYTASGKLVVGGKSADQNDQLLKEIKSLRQEMIVMHTSSPGSPFSIILSEKNKVTKNDIEECAVFTASFSRAWRGEKTKTEIDIFSSSQVYKSKVMKKGTWGVAGKVEKISVPLELVLTKQVGVLRAVPEKSAKKGGILLKIAPGKIEKKDMPTKLSLELNDSFSQEEVLSALPSGGFKIIRK